LKAFSLDSEPSSRRLLKRLARLRKPAGKVRDMDVLTDFASTVRQRNVPTFDSGQGRLFRQKRNAEKSIHPRFARKYEIYSAEK
jgi:CHAD domain-containing protein